MKKIVSALLLINMFMSPLSISYAATQTATVQAAGIAKNTNAKKEIKYNTNAPVMKYAFILDGKSDKDNAVLDYFKSAIIKSTAPEFKAVFPQNLIFVSDWSQDGIQKACTKALNSDASVVISLGYASSQYLNKLDNKRKFVITIDQYGLRSFGDKTFNPASQLSKQIITFQKLTNFTKAAVLVNENFIKITPDWKRYLGEIDYKIIPVGKDITKIKDSLPTDCDAIVYTPLYNLTDEQRTTLIADLNTLKLPSFSTVGKEDVEFGVLYGSSTIDFDKKLAEATSFSIKETLKGNVKHTEKIQFFDEELIYVNKDTADEIGFQPHLRVLNNGVVITSKKLPEYTLTDVFEMLENQNLDIERKKLLLKAARRSSTSAILRYLPTVKATLGYQQYNSSYAESAKLLYPEKTGVFQLGIDQVIYSPALVTNILIKKKQVNFNKAEVFLTEQTMGLEMALLYIETLMLENIISVHEEYVLQTRENLSMARVREKMGYCGKEEALRWAAQLNVTEKELLELKAELKNIKIQINKLLFNDQKANFTFEELKTDNPAFYTSAINIIDYVCTPQTLEQFTDMLVQEAYRVAPELEKLRAAIKMKDYELRMYVQKFILPDAKLSLDYQDLINPSYAGDVEIPLYTPMTGLIYNSMGHSKSSSARFGVYAQWTPFEGGSKFAEIGRVKAERAELQKYLEEAKTSIESHVRETINKAISAYLVVEKNYKAMYSSAENYNQVKELYLKNEAPIAQLIDAQQIYYDSKIAALNSRYVFFKELMWVQRGICAVNWSKASPEAREFIESIKTNIKKNGDIAL